MKKVLIFVSALFLTLLASVSAEAVIKKTSATVRCGGCVINVLEEEDSGIKYLFLPPFATDELMNIKSVVSYRGSLKCVFIELNNRSEDFKAINTDKSVKKSGKIAVFDTNGDKLYAGVLEKIWGHGLTSYQAGDPSEVKNSFNLKLEKKAELIDGAGKIKKYVLLAPRMWDSSRENTGISQLMAFDIYNKLNEDGRPDICGEYVDLYVNGEYRGVYILTERMDKGGAFDVEPLEDSVKCEHNRIYVEKDCVVNGVKLNTIMYSADAKIDAKADITGGYVLEIKFDNPQGCGFITTGGGVYGIKYPECCSYEMVAYIASYVQSFENALTSRDGYFNGKHITDYADLRSLADQILLYAFFANGEFYRTSTYMYKDAGEKLYFGPVWDFETRGEGLEKCDEFLSGWIYTIPQQCNLIEKLWKWGEFLHIMYDENARMKDIIADECGSIAETIKEDSILSWKMNKLRWYQVENDRDFGTEFDYYVSAVQNRAETWYGKIWDPETYILGVNIVKNVNGDGTVTFHANVDGKAKSVSWCRLVDGKPVTVENNSYDLTVKADGSVYYCIAVGKNLAQSSEAVKRPFSISKSPLQSFFVSADIAEKEEQTESEAIDTDGAETARPDDTATADETADKIGTITVLAAAGAVFVIAAAAAVIRIIATRKQQS